MVSTSRARVGNKQKNESKIQHKIRVTGTYTNDQDTTTVLQKQKLYFTIRRYLIYKDLQYRNELSSFSF
jgi:hypothetical protein